jgi:hypothetical protein
MTVRSKVVRRSVDRAVRRVPALRNVPVLKLLAAAEVVMLTRDHLMRLEPTERRRLVELARVGLARKRHLSKAEREELATLIAKIEPRLLFGGAVEKLSPVSLPRRLLYGRHGR